MKKLLLIFFPFSINAQAQVINASSPYRVSSIATCSYLLNQYSGAAAAYSLRKLDCGYSGSAIKVRRSSDNTEQNIGFETNGGLDTSALKDFIGSNNGYVSVWYDQSGNGLNVSQTTYSNQPVIATSGVIERQSGLPSIKFVASNSNYFSGGNILNNDSLILNVYSVSKLGSAATQTIISKSNGDVASNKWTLFKLSGNAQAWYIDGFTNRSASGSFSSTSNTLFQYYANKSTDTVQVLTNNTQLAVNTSGISDGAWSTTYTLYIGAYNGSGGNVTISGYYLDGTIQEIIVYKKALNRSSVNSLINSYYSLY